MEALNSTEVLISRKFLGALSLTVIFSLSHFFCRPSGPLLRRRVVLWFSSSGTALLTASGGLVYGGPSALLGFLLRDTPRFVTLFDMLGLPLLLVRVLGFVASWHFQLLGREAPRNQLEVYIRAHRLVQGSACLPQSALVSRTNL